MIENAITTLYKGTLVLNTKGTNGYYVCLFSSRKRDAQNYAVSYETGKMGWNTLKREVGRKKNGIL